MGVATTRSMERVAAAVGALEGAETRFERAEDVPHGGVLCALAALLTFGLLRHAKSHFSAPKGFYPMESIFLVLSYLALVWPSTIIKWDFAKIICGIWRCFFAL